MSPAAQTHGKRAADTTNEAISAQSQPARNPKTPRPDMDQRFSSQVKDRLLTHTRTGQACDRCKVRKIRCDRLPGGCSNCINNNIKCYVTDPVTLQSAPRGYTKDLLRDRNEMESHIRDLARLLEERGLEVRSEQNGALAAVWASQDDEDDKGNLREDSPGDKGSREEWEKQGWKQSGSLWTREKDEKAKFLRPTFPRSQLQSRPQDSHLGVARDQEPLSSIKGTQLTILGTTIDTASFNVPDDEEPPPDADISTALYNKSPHSFRLSTMRVNPTPEVQLPPRQEAFNYADWYFLVIGSFLPVLHKPSFLTLLARVYDEPGFLPSEIELVTVHMVFAIMYFQYWVRNRDATGQQNHLNELSNRHYHFALSKVFALVSSPDFAAVQALTLIASHTRSFPKPGSCLTICNLTLHRALEQNLHREPEQPTTGTNLRNELQKRVWWSLLSVYMAVQGRRGRPMPIKVEDFDVGFPEPIADELLGENGVDTTRTLDCHYEVGVAAFKLVPIFMEMYSNMYCVRRDPQNYTAIVEALEQQLKVWEKELPDILKYTPTAPLGHNNVGGLYLEAFRLEFRLCLRHPTVAMTDDPKMMAENTHICEETARSMLRCVEQIFRLKSLDTTWYQISVYTLCIFTMLAAHWERRTSTTMEAVSALHGEVESWLAILLETTRLLGCGPELCIQIRAVVERTIAHIHSDMKGKRLAPSSLPPPSNNSRFRTSPQKQQQQQLQSPELAEPDASSYHSHHTPTLGANESDGPQETATAYYHDSNLADPASYPVLTYGGQTQNILTNNISYEANASIYYRSHTQAAEAVAVTLSNRPDGSIGSFAPEGNGDVGTAAAAVDMAWGGVGRRHPYHDWTVAMLGADNTYGANTPLTIGNGTDSLGAAGHLTSGMAPASHTGQQWPLIVFDTAEVPGLDDA